jgi:hypothetical protein
VSTATRTLALRRLLREFLAEHADQLGIDPASIASPRPNAVVASDEYGNSVVSIDFGDYSVTR